jgi:hypothetical protein
MNAKYGLWYQGENTDSVWEQGTEENIWTYEG